MANDEWNVAGYSTRQTTTYKYKHAFALNLLSPSKTLSCGSPSSSPALVAPGYGNGNPNAAPLCRQRHQSSEYHLWHHTDAGESIRQHQDRWDDAWGVWVNGNTKIHPQTECATTAITDQANAQDYNRFKEQCKKASHCKVANNPVPFFYFLGGYAHHLWLEVKYFGKFAKFTKTLANNTPLSDCIKLHQCMQGHLNFHLSSTSLIINRIDNFDTIEVLCNTVNSFTIAKVTLCCQSYTLWDACCLKLENGSPLFLQGDRRRRRNLRWRRRPE